MIPTRSATRCTSERVWLDRNTVRPVWSDLAYHRLELALHQGIESGAGLVHDQHLRSFMNAWISPTFCRLPDDKSPTFLTGRHRVARRVVDVLPIDAAAQVGEVGERVPPGEVRVHGQVARHVADVVADLDGLIVRVEAENRGAARGRTDLVEDRADRRRLAGAVRAEEPEYLAVPDVEVQIHESLHVAVMLGQVLGVNGDLVGHEAPSFSAGASTNASFVSSLLLIPL